MKVTDLPKGSAPQPLQYPHFPTRWQAFVWRNWGVVPSQKIADTLQCSLQEVKDAAVAMGLQADPIVEEKWLSHGYLTIIRANWQLLPYEQLLELLGWTPEKLSYTLKEEDFFWIKLGSLKPECEPLKYHQLTAEQQDKTAKIKAVMQSYFPADQQCYQDQPFAFLERFAPRPSVISNNRFDFNFIHSFSASCGDVLGNAETLDPIPESLLAQYASMGVKGVWMHALLHKLCPIPGAEEYSDGYQERIANLQKIVARCNKYGVKVYLYFNEPRCMPAPFYEKKPHWGGYEVANQNTKTICTTRTSEPLEWLESATKSLFTQVNDLGGIFCITKSENPTNCYSRYHKDGIPCPFCSKELEEKVIADVICAMERGMHAAAPEAKLIAYDWAWKRGAFNTLDDGRPLKHCILDRLPKSVYVLSVSEWGLVTHIGGVEQSLVDYSISQVGPSDESKSTWAHARELGLKTVAKVQINNSWELSAVPYIPVPYLIEEHLNNLKKEGVTGLMLSWTLGGFPGGNLDLLSATPEEIAQSKYQPENAKEVCRAWKIFSDAFRNFPFHVLVLYRGPMNYGPMNLLHREKTGYEATMIGFPYDDLETWRGPYPEDILENQFKLVTEGWQEGLAILDNLKSQISPKEADDFQELCTVAQTSYYHLRSTYLQIRFVRNRNNADAKEILNQILKEEIELAQKLHEIVRNNSQIGFEASNHYYYTLNDLREKVLSCTQLME